MQMFGVGLPELMVILLLSVLVIGPDRVPEFAADLARWIRRARAYGEHLTRDFNEVISDIEKEVGTSRDDWREIASVVTRHTGDITRELSIVSSEATRSLDVNEANVPAATAPAAVEEPSNIVSFDSSRSVEGAADEATDAGGPETAEPGEEKPWYVPDTGVRRRPSE